MKKQNILDLLCDDLVTKFYTKQENFKKCITDFDKCINENIIPFLVDYQTDFGYVFDLNSNNTLVKEKSQYILCVIIKEFKELVSRVPDYFLATQEKGDFDTACRTFLINILKPNDIKTMFKL